jgi:exodeoxyribonuclease V alpha subunit
MPALTPDRTKLTGKLIAFRAMSEDGWGVGTLDVGTEAIRVTGKLLGAREGDTVEIEGAWSEHPKYGRQLRVIVCTVARPETEEGIVSWLSSTLPDVGVGRARKLVARFGTELWHVIEHEHERLTEVDGITQKRASAIAEAYLKHKAERDDMILLRGWGLTDNQIGKCLAQWHTLRLTVQKVGENPYQLAQYVYGFGFERADKVAMRAGVTYDSPLRIEAALDHVLEEASGKGHCYLPSGALQLMTQKLLGVQERLVVDAVRAAIRSGRVVLRGDSRLYSQRMDRAEQCCADALRQLLERAA